jgi:hypothetical protein
MNESSRQWYLKFHEVRMTFGFKENIVDQCIYLKVSGSKFLFLVLYVDNILLLFFFFQFFKALIFFFKKIW